MNLSFMSAEGHMHVCTSELNVIFLIWHIFKVNITLLRPFITVQWVEPDKCGPPNPNPDQTGKTATTHLFQSSVTAETK